MFLSPSWQYHVLRLKIVYILSPQSGLVNIQNKDFYFFTFKVRFYFPLCLLPKNAEVFLIDKSDVILYNIGKEMPGDKS